MGLVYSPGEWQQVGDSYEELLALDDSVKKVGLSKAEQANFTMVQTLKKDDVCDYHPPRSAQRRRAPALLPVCTVCARRAAACSPLRTKRSLAGSFAGSEVGRVEVLRGLRYCEG